MISLIHPSKGRPQKAKQNLENWISKLSGEHDIEHILSLDYSDENLDEYTQLFSTFTKVLVTDNTCVVDATNVGARHSIGEILVYMSDDFDCPNNWDELIYRVIQPYGDEPICLKVDDCLQPFYAEIITMPIMNRALYEQLGYMWHPDYKSMFVDEDLYWTVKINKWLHLCPQPHFQHNHWLNGKSEQDETYKATESFWNQGKQLFQKRKLNGFPL